MRPGNRGRQAVAEVHQKECPKCGAPIRQAQGQTHLTCEFCGATLELQLSKDEKRELREQQEAKARAGREERARKEREEDERRAREPEVIRPGEHNTGEDMARMLGQVGQVVNVGGMVQSTVRTAVSTVVTGCIVAAIVGAAIIGLVVYLVLKL